MRLTPVKVYHRLNTTAAYKFDGRDYHFKPHETVYLDSDTAAHLCETTVFKYDPSIGEVLKAIVAEGDPLFETPYEGEIGLELLDRTNDPEPFVKRGIEGAPRKTVYKQVAGVENDMKKSGATGVFS